jgi:hypothetical protein
VDKIAAIDGFVRRGEGLLHIRVDHARNRTDVSLVCQIMAREKRPFIFMLSKRNLP